MLLDNEVDPSLCDRHQSYAGASGVEADIQPIRLGEAPPKRWTEWLEKGSKQLQALGDAAMGSSTAGYIELDKPQNLQERLDLQVGYMLAGQLRSPPSKALRANTYIHTYIHTSDRTLPFWMVGGGSAATLPPHPARLKEETRRDQGDVKKDSTEIKRKNTQAKTNEKKLDDTDPNTPATVNPSPLDEEMWEQANK